MHITHLRTSTFNRPLGLDKTPLFSWRVEDATPEMLIPSANIQVLDASGAEVWDSGVVATPTVLEVLYAGPALAPRTQPEMRSKSHPRPPPASPKVSGMGGIKKRYSLCGIKMWPHRYAMIASGSTRVRAKEHEKPTPRSTRGQGPVESQRQCR